MSQEGRDVQSACRQRITAEAREHLSAWLRAINRRAMPDNNWLFFGVLVNLGLAHVGVEHDELAMHAALDRLEAFYLGDGWYADGMTAQRDYYVPFAFHYYGLIYERLAEKDRPSVRAAIPPARGCVRAGLHPLVCRRRRGAPVWP